jgi:hypothetical protein
MINAANEKSVEKSVEKSIHEIHTSGRQLVFEFTGAGSLALAWLHSVPGSSRTILEATDRYSDTSLAELLAHSPMKSVDPQTAGAMAQRAYLHACRLGDENHPRIGIACTATIATDREKAGAHRVCVAVRDNRQSMTLDLTLTKGKRTRLAEESLIANIIIDAIASATGASRLPIQLLPREQLVSDLQETPDPVDLLWSSQTPWVAVDTAGHRLAAPPVRGIIYSGSFNPLHFGHLALAAAATATGSPVTFEIPAINADKAPLTRAELERRLSQFTARHDVLITRAPLFSDKARLFPGCTFLMGYDTAQRLIDPRFYNDSPSARDQALADLRTSSCRLLVAGRLDGDQYKTLADLPLPPELADLFINLSGFRADISATSLRAQHGIPDSD